MPQNQKSEWRRRRPPPNTWLWRCTTLQPHWTLQPWLFQAVPTPRRTAPFRTRQQTLCWWTVTRASTAASPNSWSWRCMTRRAACSSATSRVTAACSWPQACRPASASTSPYSPSTARAPVTSLISARTRSSLPPDAPAKVSTSWLHQLLTEQVGDLNFFLFHLKYPTWVWGQKVVQNDCPFLYIFVLDGNLVDPINFVEIFKNPVLKLEVIFF